MKIVVFWFRRDLRLEDNTGLNAALRSGYPVVPVFIYDSRILERLASSADRRVDYIHQGLSAMNKTLKQQHHSALYTFHGTVLQAFAQIAGIWDIHAVYGNQDYEPYAIKRDKEVQKWLQDQGIPLMLFKDQVIFEKNEVTRNDGAPYTVFTPYSRKWLSQIQEESLKPGVYAPENFFRFSGNFLSLESVGFKKTDIRFIQPEIPEEIISHYHLHRDYPARDGTSKLGMALRFGTLSIRKCVAYAQQRNATWLKELIWREFFMQILYHFPKVETNNFKPQYDFVEWRNNEEEFEKWCMGQTGYAFVDAGMRQLNSTGFMHNRSRMIAASFLCKHLLIDWRWGEAYFGNKLNDYDLAANNGNWQWAAGSGCDAAPYFRIFNPDLQLKKFDPDRAYSLKWNAGNQTATPIVNHEFARNRALKAFAAAINMKNG